MGAVGGCATRRRHPSVKPSYFSSSARPSNITLIRRHSNRSVIQGETCASYGNYLRSNVWVRRLGPGGLQVFHHGYQRCLVTARTINEIHRGRDG